MDGHPTHNETRTRHQENNTCAIVSLIFGIVSYVILPFIGAIIAVIAGHIARSQIRRRGQDGADLALVGLILGYVQLACWVLALVILCIFIYQGNSKHTDAVPALMCIQTLQNRCAESIAARGRNTLFRTYPTMPDATENIPSSALNPTA